MSASVSSNPLVNNSRKESGDTQRCGGIAFDEMPSSFEMEWDYYGDGGYDRLCHQGITNPSNWLNVNELETSLRNRNTRLTGMMNTRVNTSKDSNGSPKATNLIREPYKIVYEDGTEEAVYSVPSTEYLSCFSSSSGGLIVKQHLDVPLSDFGISVGVDFTVSPRSKIRYALVDSDKLQGKSREKKLKQRQVSKWLEQHYNSGSVRHTTRRKRKTISRKDKKRICTKLTKELSNTSLSSRWTSLWRDGDSSEDGSDIDIHKVPSSLPSSLLNNSGRKHQCLDCRKNEQKYTKCRRQRSDTSLSSRWTSLWRDGDSSEGSSEADSYKVLGTLKYLPSEELDTATSMSKFYRCTYISPSSSLESSNFSKEEAVRQREGDRIYNQYDSVQNGYVLSHFDQLQATPEKNSTSRSSMAVNSSEISAQSAENEQSAENLESHSGTSVKELIELYENIIRKSASNSDNERKVSKKEANKYQMKRLDRDLKLESQQACHSVKAQIETDIGTFQTRSFCTKGYEPIKQSVQSQMIHVKNDEFSDVSEVLASRIIKAKENKAILDYWRQYNKVFGVEEGKTDSKTETTDTEIPATKAVHLFYQKQNLYSAPEPTTELYSCPRENLWLASQLTKDDVRTAAVLKLVQSVITRAENSIRLDYWRQWNSKHGSQYEMGTVNNVRSESTAELYPCSRKNLWLASEITKNAFRTATIIQLVQCVITRAENGLILDFWRQWNSKYGSQNEQEVVNNVKPNSTNGSCSRKNLRLACQITKDDVQTTVISQLVQCATTQAENGISLEYWRQWNSKHGSQNKLEIVNNVSPKSSATALQLALCVTSQAENGLCLKYWRQWNRNHGSQNELELVNNVSNESTTEGNSYSRKNIHLARKITKDVVGRATILHLVQCVTTQAERSIGLEYWRQWNQKHGGQNEMEIVNNVSREYTATVLQLDQCATTQAENGVSQDYWRQWNSKHCSQNELENVNNVSNESTTEMKSYSKKNLHLARKITKDVVGRATVLHLVQSVTTQAERSIVLEYWRQWNQKHGGQNEMESVNNVSREYTATILQLDQFATTQAENGVSQDYWRQWNSKHSSENELEIVIKMHDVVVISQQLSNGAVGFTGTRNISKIPECKLVMSLIKPESLELEKGPIQETAVTRLVEHAIIQGGNELLLEYWRKRNKAYGNKTTRQLEAFSNTDDNNVSVVKVISERQTIDRNITSRIQFHSMATMDISSGTNNGRGREATFENWMNFNRDEGTTKIPVRKSSNLGAILSFAVKRLTGFVLQQSEKEMIFQYWRKWNKRNSASECIVTGNNGNLKSLIAVGWKDRGKMETSESVSVNGKRNRTPLNSVSNKSLIPVRGKKILKTVKTKDKPDAFMIVMLARSIVLRTVENAKQIVTSGFLNTKAAKKKNVRFKARGQHLEYSLNGPDSKTDVTIILNGNSEKTRKENKYPRTHYPKIKPVSVWSAECGTREDDSNSDVIEANGSINRDQNRDLETLSMDNSEKLVSKPKNVYPHVDLDEGTAGIDVAKMRLEHGTNGYNDNVSVVKIMSEPQTIDRNVSSRIPMPITTIDGRAHSIATRGISSWVIHQGGREITFEYWRNFNRGQGMTKIPVRKSSNLGVISSFVVKRLTCFVLQQSGKELMLQHWREWNRRNAGPEYIVNGTNRKLKSLIPVRKKVQGNTETSESVPTDRGRKRISMMPASSKSRVPVKQKKKVKSEDKLDPPMLISMVNSVQPTVECAQRKVTSGFLNSKVAKKKNVRFKERGEQLEYSLNGLDMDSKSDITIKFSDDSDEKICSEYPHTHYAKSVLSASGTPGDDSEYVVSEANGCLQRGHSKEFNKLTVDNSKKVVTKPKQVDRKVDGKMERNKDTTGIDVATLQLERGTKPYFRGVPEAPELPNKGVNDKTTCQSVRRKPKYPIDGRIGKSEVREKEPDKPAKVYVKHSCCCSKRDANDSSTEVRKHPSVKANGSLKRDQKRDFDKLTVDRKENPVTRPRQIDREVHDEVERHDGTAGIDVATFQLKHSNKGYSRGLPEAPELPSNGVIEKTTCQSVRRKTKYPIDGRIGKSEGREKEPDLPAKTYVKHNCCCTKRDVTDSLADFRKHPSVKRDRKVEAPTKANVGHGVKRNENGLQSDNFMGMHIIHRTTTSSVCCATNRKTRTTRAKPSDGNEMESKVNGTRAMSSDGNEMKSKVNVTRAMSSDGNEMKSKVNGTRATSSDGNEMESKVNVTRAMSSDGNEMKSKVNGTRATSSDGNEMESKVNGTRATSSDGNEMESKVNGTRATSSDGNEMESKVNGTRATSSDGNEMESKVNGTRATSSDSNKMESKVNGTRAMSSDGNEMESKVNGTRATSSDGNEMESKVNGTRATSSDGNEMESKVNGTRATSSDGNEMESKVNGTRATSSDGNEMESKVNGTRATSSDSNELESKVNGTRAMSSDGNEMESKVNVTRATSSDGNEMESKVNVTRATSSDGNQLESKVNGTRATSSDGNEMESKVNGTRAMSSDGNAMESKVNGTRATSSDGNEMESKVNGTRATSSDGNEMESKVNGTRATSSDSNELESKVNGTRAMSSDGNEMESKVNVTRATSSDGNEMESKVNVTRATSSDRNELESKVNGTRATSSDGNEMESKVNVTRAMSSDGNEMESKVNVTRATSSDRNELESKVNGTRATSSAGNEMESKVNVTRATSSDGNEMESKVNGTRAMSSDGNEMESKVKRKDKHSKPAEAANQKSLQGMIVEVENQNNLGVNDEHKSESYIIDIKRDTNDVGQCAKKSDNEELYRPFSFNGHSVTCSLCKHGLK